MLTKDVVMGVADIAPTSTALRHGEMEGFIHRMPDQGLVTAAHEDKG